MCQFCASKISYPNASAEKHDVCAVGTTSPASSSSLNGQQFAVDTPKYLELRGGNFTFCCE